MTDENVINLDERRAARTPRGPAPAAAASAARRATAHREAGWLCRVDVFAPSKPGEPHRFAFLDLNLSDGMDSTARLEGFADAFEQVAVNLRAVARATIS